MQSCLAAPVRMGHTADMIPSDTPGPFFEREKMVRSRSRYLFGAMGVLILGTASVPTVVVSKAPFRRNQLTGMLQAAGFTDIQIGTFEQKWYPPGFAAGRVRLVGKHGGILTIENVTP